MFKSALRFGSLLIQQIIEDILVALDESLRVLLPVLQLLITVTLDALQQCSQRQLLSVSQFSLFLLQHCLHFSLQFVSFEFLKQVSLHLNLFSFFVALAADELRLLVSQLKQVL